MIYESSEELLGPLQAHFPRLYDLYINSERNNPHNYFEHPNCLAAVKRADAKLMEIETTLQLMEPTAWQVFRTKTVYLLTAIDKWDWNTQLFDRFDEAKGYGFLKEQGYTNIQFIPERQDLRTPDLWGTRQDGGAILEVKTVHESEDENDRLMRRGKYEGKELESWEVEHFLNEAMRGKLQRTIENAAEQLAYPEKGIHRRILLLFVRLDLKCATHRTRQFLEEFLRSFDLKGIEIQHFLKNEFFLD